MDALSSILEVTKLKGLVCDRLVVSGPWGLEVVQTENAQFWRLIKGSCIVSLYDSQPVSMQEGDIVIIPHGASHWVADHVSSRRVTPAEYINGNIDGSPFFKGPGEETIVIGGHFSFDQNQTHPFIKDLPPVIRISQFGTRYGKLLEHTAGLMMTELDGEHKGSTIMRRNLAEILFVTVIRAYLEQSSQHTGFLSALGDSQISNALKLMHDMPEQNWTLESLAKSVAMSRSVFAGRFKKLVGETPLSYLTNWRINRARDLLTTEKLSMDEIAFKIGYHSEQAFNRVFKAKTGKTPAIYRKSRM
ncbi:helix-turn-helix domain-containing protein [Chitinophaga oryziterrae]|uniref:Helix-turn-helix domain-containing protein n=1 Tax=Chitinophaga oryziterrae TaxID=1031224 RepID=A0A6N8JA32_9BACT|nr:cupin domain-containing protein [Chitinophaga oryziterrae]MVT41089.1 helix-turn-helix domain-containing protein [Chitinophaga oryziterrae]